MKGRVLLVSHAGELGGAEYALVDLARHFGPEDCHVVLFADGPLRRLLEAESVGVTVLAGAAGMMGVTRDAHRIRALRAIPAIIGMALRLARIARQYRMLYLNSQKAAVVGMIAGALARRPTVWHVHDIMSAEHFATLQRRVVVSMANRLARRVIANSEVTRRSFIASGGRPERAVVVLNGIDTKRFMNLDPGHAAAERTALGLADRKLVGLFGRITPWKGQHVLLKALAELPNVHALMVGDALFKQDDYKASLIEQAARLGVANRVHWLGFRDDIPQLMRMVDVVVHTSTAPEPFGRVIIEGVLADRPVIASSHGASEELLGADYRWLVPAGDPAALAEAIRGLLAQPEAAIADLTSAQKQRALQLFTLPQMMLRIERAVAPVA